MFTLNTDQLATLQEINLYPYLTWAFYGVILFASPLWLRRDRNLFILFLLTLPLETAFTINVGFFIRPSYITGILLIFRIAAKGIRLPGRATVLLLLLTIVAVSGIFLNLDLLGKSQSSETHATFLRPLIQLGQLTTLILIAAVTFTSLGRGGFFRDAMRVLHWVSVAVACSALYELAAIYFHLPYLNLNNMLPAYWYPGFGTALLYIFRVRVTFIEPIELNNFQMLGIASSLAYRELEGKRGWRYWALFILQCISLIVTFSRSTLLTVLFLAPVFILFYPRTVQSSVTGESALWYLVDRSMRLAFVVFIAFTVLYTFTVTPEQLKRSNAVVQTVFTRLILHQNNVDRLAPWGRAGAIDEVSRLADGGRLAFGVGLGNEANWWGGEGGTFNMYDQIILYSGLIGLSIFFIFAGSLLLQLFQNALNHSNSLRFQKMCWIFFIALSGILVQRLAFSGFLTDTYLWVVFAITMYLGQAERFVNLTGARGRLELAAEPGVIADPELHKLSGAANPTPSL